MAKYCTNCGHELRDTDKYCAECGAGVGGVASQNLPQRTPAGHDQKDNFAADYTSHAQEAPQTLAPTTVPPIGLQQRHSTPVSRVALKHGLIVGGILGPAGGIAIAIIDIVFSLDAFEGTSASSTAAIVGLLALLAWCLYTLLHPLIAGFFAVKSTRRLRSGIGAGLLAGCIYAFPTVVAIVIAVDVYNPSTYGVVGDVLLDAVLVVIVTDMAFGAWFLPCMALASLGGLAAKIFTSRTPLANYGQGDIVDRDHASHASVTPLVPQTSPVAPTYPSPSQQPQQPYSPYPPQMPPVSSVPPVAPMTPMPLQQQKMRTGQEQRKRVMTWLFKTQRGQIVFWVTIAVTIVACVATPFTLAALNAGNTAAIANLPTDTPYTAPTYPPYTPAPYTPAPASPVPTVAPNLFIFASTLGGTRADFQQKYGTPTDGSGDIYAATIAGQPVQIMLSFDRPGDSLDGQEHAMVVDVQVPSDQLGSEHWSVTTASTIAKAFLPVDARFQRTVTIHPVSNTDVTERIYTSKGMAATFTRDLFTNDSGTVLVPAGTLSYTCQALPPATSGYEWCTITIGTY